MKKGHYILAIIFILTLATRLILAFQTPHFTGEESYFTLRQAEHIRSTGLPIFYDEFSYGGKDCLFTPFFYYFIAFFSLFLPMALVGKIVPNVLVSLMPIIVYFISKDISNDEDASLFSAFIAGFIPIFFKETVNSISALSLVFPLMLLMIHCFLRINKKNNAYYFLIALLILVLTSPAVVILIIGLLFYLFLVRLENLKQSKLEIELIIFSVIFVTWMMFIIFKKAFLAHGLEVIWQNIPREVLKRYFADITVLGAIYQIGSLPLSYGVYSVYDNLFRKKQRKVYVIIGFAFSAALLLWLRLIELELGLMCLGIMVTLLFPKFYTFTFDYLKKTRFARLKTFYFILLLGAFIVASVIPSVSSGISAVNNAVSDEDYNALRWIEQKTEENSTVISAMREGILISTIADRKNVADSNFLLQEDAEQRFGDIEAVYKARFETEALRILNKYDVRYIYLSKSTKKQFGIENLEYASDDKCFNLRYNNGAEVYKVLCELK